jgi:Ca-activated chloride channel family protein
MKHHDEKDRKIAELFSAARRADEASTPGFRHVLWRRRENGADDRRPVPLVRVGFLAGVSVFAVAAVALWLGVRNEALRPPTSGPVFHPGMTRPDASSVPDARHGNAAGTGSLGGAVVGEVTLRSHGSTDEASSIAATPAPADPMGEPALPSPPPAPPPPPRYAAGGEQTPLAAPAGSAKSTSDARILEEDAARLFTSPGYAGDSAKKPEAGQAALDLLTELKGAEAEAGLQVRQAGLGEPDAIGVEDPSNAPTVGFRRSVPVPTDDEGAAGRAARTMFLQAALSRADALESPEQVEDPRFNTEGYALLRENDFLAVADNPLSTFSIDVDTASYTNVRRFLNGGLLPPRDAVRIEELINYFDYDYPQPDGDAPFSATVEVAGCPWKPEHRLARIGLKGREIERGAYRGSNLVFLIDVSGSMQAPNKLPLVKSALAMLVEQLDGRDQVAIVVYAGSSGEVLSPTPGDAKSEIRDAIDDLEAGGSTNGGEGLKLAYRLARRNFIGGGVNRVILATDGDFNVGVTGKAELLRLIEKDARRGIFLTALGVGMGNYKDDTLELLADRGNGNYAYLDSLKEARRVLVEQIGGTLVTIAKDVKIQVEFNPLQVGAYRLIGYENRMLSKEDFNDDRKDAGEIGAGHTVTALYELAPPGEELSKPAVDPLKYQEPQTFSTTAESGELLTLKLRYKEPQVDTSRLLVFPVVDAGLSLDAASEDFKFAAAVAMFGMVLRDSEHRGEASLHEARRLSLEGMPIDAGGLRSEFYDLVDRAVAIGAD